MSVLDTLLDSLIRNSSFTLTSIFARIKFFRENSIDESEFGDSDLLNAVNACREEIARSESAEDIPSSRHFEKVAIYSRSARNYENEIAICKMYIDLVNKYIYKHNPSKDYIDNELIPLCEPLMHRINNAKTLMPKDWGVQA